MANGPDHRPQSGLLYIAGDWHGSTDWAIKQVRIANRLGISRVMQLGDFGLWDHTVGGVRYLDALNEVCRKLGLQVWWLDGNHENFNSLEQYVSRAPRDAHGHVYIRSHILYCRRGHSWTSNGKSMMSVGGAVSIDRMLRNVDESWWPQEQLREDQLLAACAKRVDYLFTHDCPSNIPYKGQLYVDADSDDHRRRMDVLGRAVRPTMWFHGHMHQQCDYMFPHDDGATRVFGLDCDYTNGNWLVLNIRTGKVAWSPTSRKALASLSGV